MNAQSSTRNRAPLSASAPLRHQPEVHANRRVAQLASTVHRRVPCVELDPFLHHGWRELGQVLDDQPSQREVEHGFNLISWVVIAKVGKQNRYLVQLRCCRSYHYLHMYCGILASESHRGQVRARPGFSFFSCISRDPVRDFLFQTNTPTRAFGQ